MPENTGKTWSGSTNNDKPKRKDGAHTNLTMTVYFEPLAKVFGVTDPETPQGLRKLIKLLYNDVLKPLGIDSAEAIVHSDDVITQYEVDEFWNKHRNDTKAEKEKLVPPVIGETKKLHGHINMHTLGTRGKGMKPATLFKKLVDACNGVKIGPYVEAIVNVLNMHLYLMHLSKDARAFKKHVYDKDDIMVFDGYTVAGQVKLSREYKEKSCVLIVNHGVRANRLEDVDTLYDWLDEHEGQFNGLIPSSDVFNSSFAGDYRQRVVEVVKGVYAFEEKKRKAERQAFEDERHDREREEDLAVAREQIAKQDQLIKTLLERGN